MKKQLFLGLALLGAATALDAKVLSSKEIENKQIIIDWKLGQKDGAKNTCYRYCDSTRKDNNIKGIESDEKNSTVAMQGADLMCTCTDDK